MVTKFSQVATKVWRFWNSGGRSSRWAMPRLLVGNKIPNSIFGSGCAWWSGIVRGYDWFVTPHVTRRLTRWLPATASSSIVWLSNDAGVRSQLFSGCVTELTVLYAAARTVDVQIQLRSDLRRSSATTDQSLADLPVWPSSAADDGTPAMLRSRGLLGAVLERRREVFVETGGGSGRFWDAMGFYTDVMDVVIGWLYRAVADLHRRLRQHDRSAGY